MAVDKNKSLIMAHRLKELRNEKGLSHESLRKALMEKYEIEISPDSLKNYEVSNMHHVKAYKNNGMRVEFLRCFADLYGVSADYILGSTDIKSSDPDIQAAIDITELSEESVSILCRGFSVKMLNHYFHKLVDELIEIVDKEDDLLTSYVVMQSVASREWTFDNSNYIEDMTQLNLLCDKLGQINLSREEFMEYYITKITDRIKRGLIQKYASRENVSSDSGSNNE